MKKRNLEINHCFPMRLAHFSIIILLFFTATGYSQIEKKVGPANFTFEHGAIVRGDSTQKKLTLVFTGDTFADGADHVIKVLQEHRVKGAFFFTGNFYRNPDFGKSINTLIGNGHYLGAHSDKHLLYCDWENRDSLLVTRKEFSQDLKDNYKEMERFGITKEQAPYFLPPYEWYNDTISKWTKMQDLQLINISYGTLSHADYTTPKMPNYRDSEEIFKSIINFEEQSKTGINGFLLLVHIGTDPDRKDKFYYRLSELISTLKSKGYQIVGLKELLGSN